MMFFAFSFGMILSNLLGQSQAVAPEAKEPSLFVYKGIDKTKQDLSPDMLAAVNKLDSRRYRLLENAGLEQHLHQTAYDQNISLEEAGKIMFKLEQPTSSQVDQFYQDNAKKLNKPFYQVKDHIKKQLMSTQAQQAKHKILGGLKGKGDLIILFKP